MPYNHGIRIKENPTSVPEPITSEAGVPVIFGTAPVNLVTNPAGAVNKLFLCHTFAEAKAALGYSDDYASYSLCQAMDAFFKVFAVGPIVLCNVLDPSSNKTALTESLTVTAGQAKFEAKGVLLSGLTLRNGDTPLEIDTDYTLEFDEDGTLVVTVIADGVASIAATGFKLDPSSVSAADVVGSYNASTGAETGIELVRKVYPEFNLVPNLLLAPGWSNTSAVGLALIAKCKEINGSFRCECVLDIDTTAAPKYTDVYDQKIAAGYVSECAICVWPKVKAIGKVFDYSAIYAALCVYTDINNDNVPNLSPSNKEVRISATVIDAAGTEVNLDTVQANTLNEKGIVTAINVSGFKAWGNNTACYPTNTDPKDRWICCRRFFSWWGNSFIVNYFDKVDDPMNYRLIESIVDSENVRGNSLVSEGKCAGIKMVYSQEDNPTGNLIAGKIVFRQYLAPYTPAEDILNILEFDTDMIQTALGGE